MKIALVYDLGTVPLGFYFKDVLYIAKHYNRVIYDGTRPLSCPPYFIYHRNGLFDHDYIKIIEWTSLPSEEKKHLHSLVYG